MKWVVCGVVALAAVAVMAARISRTPASDAQASKTYASVAPAVVPTAPPVVVPTVPPVVVPTVPTVVETSIATVVATVGVAKAETTVVANEWGSPLRSLSELNKVAADTDAIFLVLPSTNVERMAEIRKEVLASASTITDKGTRMGTFLLSQDSQEYAGFVKQIGAPAVIAMCKGLGMAPVPDKQITQESLLKAFVSASRPSGCGPSSSGCGPSSAGCK